MKNTVFEFNNGRSAIHLDYLPANQAWCVYRSDGDHQALLRIHNGVWDATCDYKQRVDFVKQMEAIA